MEAALALVIVDTVAGASRRRAALLGAVTMAVIGFTYFDTQPYERFQIGRSSDLVIALLLAVVGLTTGELTLRAVRGRADEQSAAGRLRRVQDAASLVARGEELAVLTDTVAGEIEALLPGVQQCWFSSDALPDGTIELDRSGRHSLGGGSPSVVCALPVWALGQVVGHYLIGPASALADAADGQLLTATALADQVGAAFAVHVGLPPVPAASTSSGDRRPAAALRVVRNP